MNHHDKSGDDLSRLYRAAEQPQPPSALDAAILAAARAAAESRPQPVIQRNFARRWRVPLALAATVVLSVAVTTMVRDELPSEAIAFKTLDAPTQPSAEIAAPAAKASVEARRAEPPATPAYEPALPIARARAARESRQAADAVASAAAERERPDNAVPPALSAASPAAQGALAADAAPRARREERAAPESAISAQSVEKRAFSSSLRDEAKAGAAAMEEKSPAAWIADIRELKRMGRTTEAAAKRVEFTKRFPSYRLPDDLK